MKLNERIKAWREARPDVASSAIAAACGVSRQAVAQWQDGTTTPTLRNLDRLVTALGVSMARFYGPIPPSRKRAA